MSQIYTFFGTDCNSFVLYAYKLLVFYLIYLQLYCFSLRINTKTVSIMLILVINCKFYVEIEKKERENVFMVENPHSLWGCLGGGKIHSFTSLAYILS